MTMAWTEESLRYENEYRRDHLRQVAGLPALGSDGSALRGHRSTRSASWWRWLHLSLRH